MSFAEVIDDVGKGVDLAGVAVMVAGAGIASAFFVGGLSKQMPFQQAYRLYRHGLAWVHPAGLGVLGSE